VSVEYLCNKSSGSENLEKSTQESSNLSSLIIITDDAHERQKYASLNKHLGEKQTMHEDVENMMMTYQSRRFTNVARQQNTIHSRIKSDEDANT
jgi:hypothetical protein